jgi:hypothetical protein
MWACTVALEDMMDPQLVVGQIEAVALGRVRMLDVIAMALLIRIHQNPCHQRRNQLLLI